MVVKMVELKKYSIILTQVVDSTSTSTTIVLLSSTNLLIKEYK